MSPSVFDFEFTFIIIIIILNNVVIAINTNWFSPLAGFWCDEDAAAAIALPAGFSAAPASSIVNAGYDGALWLLRWSPLLLFGLDDEGNVPRLVPSLPFMNFQHCGVGFDL